MNLFDVCFLILKRKTKLRLGFFGITAKKVFIRPKHPSALWDLLDSNYIAMFGLTKVIAKYFSIKQPGAFAHEILRLVLFCFFSFAHNRVASPASPLSLGSDAPLLPLTFGFDRITTHRSGPLPTGGLFGGRDSPLATPCGGGELRSAAPPLGREQLDARLLRTTRRWRSRSLLQAALAVFHYSSGSSNRFGLDYFCGCHLQSNASDLSLWKRRVTFCFQ